MLTTFSPPARLLRIPQSPGHRSLPPQQSCVLRMPEAPWIFGCLVNVGCFLVYFQPPNRACQSPKQAYSPLRPLGRSPEGWQEVFRLICWVLSEPVQVWSGKPKALMSIPHRTPGPSSGHSVPQFPYPQPSQGCGTQRACWRAGPREPGPPGNKASVLRPSSGRPLREALLSLPSGRGGDRGWWRDVSAQGHPRSAWVGAVPSATTWYDSKTEIMGCLP